MRLQSKKQTGISLLELMVSLSIGLILLLTLATVYVTSIKTNKIRDINAELDEAARQVFDRLEQDLNLAGYIDIFDSTYAQDIVQMSDAGVKKMFGRIIDPTAVQNPLTPIEKATGAVGLEGTDDSLTVRYQVALNSAGAGKSLSGAAADADESGWGRDCLGQENTGSGNFVENRYEFSNNAFRCTGTHFAPPAVAAGFPGVQPIVGDGGANTTRIESMYFRYLVTDATRDAAAKLSDVQSGLYVSNIINAAGVQATELGWSGVVGVEVCMVVGGSPLTGQLAGLAAQQQQLPTCDRDASGVFAADTARTNGDNRLYRRYVKIFNVPNALYFTP